jgi:SAM-dependent methyltransferase
MQLVRIKLPARDKLRQAVKQVLRPLGLLGPTVRLLERIEAAKSRRHELGAVSGLGHSTPQALDDRTMLDKSTVDLLKRELTTPVPPEDFIFVVNGHRDTANFAASRNATVSNIIKLLAGAGVDYRQFRSLLDFGCGCGRVLAGWEHLIGDGTKLCGFDINPLLIKFCQENIPFAKTAKSGYFPPLPIADGSVDFAYAASVWTHLSLQAAAQWAGEFARVIAPGGTALVSYHGSYFAPTLAQLSKEGSQQLEERGFYMHLHGAAGDTFEGSNNYATFMTSAFFRQLFAGFDILRIYPGVSHGPNPFASFQDIAVLRRI